MTGSTSKPIPGYRPHMGETTTRTDDRYHCRACLFTGPADMDRAERLTCSMCDSPDVITEALRIHELRAERERENLAEDARWGTAEREAANVAMWAAMDAEHQGGTIACGKQVAS